VYRTIFCELFLIVLFFDRLIGWGQIRGGETIEPVVDHKGN